MKTIFSSILIIDSIIAIYLFLSPIWQRKKLDTANKALHLYALASAIWSLGFGILFIQTDVEKAYFWRSFAIFGTVLYMITAQFLICLFAHISKKMQFILNFIALTGFIPYVLSIRRDQTEYFITSIGMTYRFKPGIINTIYTAYFVIVAVNILAVIVHMIITSDKKRLKVFGKHFLIITMLILLGTILDMIFPAIGLPALPGSNITQFLGLIVLFYAMNVMNKTRINVSNMSEFIYYSLAMPIMVFDEKYRLCIANEAATVFLSLPKEKDRLMKCRIEDLFNIKELTAFEFDEEHYSYDSVCMSNSTPCNLTISKIKDNYGDIIGFIVNIHDLTERMRYIEELQKARQSADSSNNAKSRFLASMSHEIRTPMNAIIGFSELALKENPSPALTDYLEDIKSSSHNLLSLINDILDISKIESGKMTLVNVAYNTADILHDIYEMIRTQAAKKGLDFRIEITPNLPSILYGDSNRIKNILINLLNNAVKYTTSGYIKLEVVCSAIDAKPFTMSLKVTDTGIGIKEEDLSLLFEEFSQMDKEINYGKEGTGLGLSLVKKYCVLMNGNIEVESTYGKGSTFTATIEQEIADSTPINLDLILSHHIKDEFSLGTLHVKNVETLIVDDNPVNCKVISKSMEYYGMNVDIATSGPESISMCRGKHYDLIFMDQMMPEMDGIEAMKQIHKLNDYYTTSANCKIIALTANAIAGVREDLIAEGFDEYLSKPVNFRDLENVLVRFIPPACLENVQPNVKASNSTDTLSELTLADMYPDINIHEGINYCGGTVDNYLEVIQIMCDEASDQIARLSQYYENGNLKEFTILIHALKGICLNIGAKECGEAAKALEMAGKSNDTEYIHSNLPSFIDRYMVMVERFNELSGKYNSNENKNKSGQNNVSHISEILKEFRQSVIDYDFAHAAALLRKAHSVSDAEEDTDLLNTLDILMDNMDIDKILSLI